MTTLRERHRRRTRTEIAEAALDLFDRQGYEETTVEQIAAAAGVSSATFFRYFPAKADVLIGDEGESTEALVAAVRARRDRAITVAALRAPVAEFAASFTDGSVPRRARLVLTTRTLEPRSLRMRLRWEQGVAAELAHERGLPLPTPAETAVAACAVACLSSALRHWGFASSDLTALVDEAFAAAAGPDAATPARRPVSPP